jgi:predicted component of type VI protein secretion system
MQVVLVMFRGEAERRSFSITRDVTVIGRREDCDFRIPLGEISRKHCRLIKDGKVLKVEDLGSSNGTFHNGERVQTAELSPGDTLQVGSTVFVVQIDGAPVDDELAPITADSSRRAAAAEPQDVTLHQAGPARGNGKGELAAGAAGAASNSGSFDPMTVLEAGSSGSMPILDDDAKISEDIMIDLAEQSSAGDNSAGDQA